MNEFEFQIQRKIIQATTGKTKLQAMACDFYSKANSTYRSPIYYDTYTKKYPLKKLQTNVFYNKLYIETVELFHDLGYTSVIKYTQNTKFDVKVIMTVDEAFKWVKENKE